MEINIYIIVAFGIIFLGFMIALFLALRGYGKAKGIKHYEKIRDELSVREEPKPEKSEGTGLDFGRILGGFVALIIGITLIPSISEAVTESQANMTVEQLTPMNQIMVNSIPIFFALAIIVIAIGVVWNSTNIFGDAGLL